MPQHLGLFFCAVHTAAGPAPTAPAGNRRFWRLSAQRARTKALYKTDLLWETLRALNRPGGPGQFPKIIQGVEIRFNPEAVDELSHNFRRNLGAGRPVGLHPISGLCRDSLDKRECNHEAYSYSVILS